VVRSHRRGEHSRGAGGRAVGCKHAVGAQSCSIAGGRRQCWALSVIAALWVQQRARAWGGTKQGLMFRPPNKGGKKPQGDQLVCAHAREERVQTCGLQRIYK